MKTKIMKFGCLLMAMSLVGSVIFAQGKILNVYNWSDYIAEETIPEFEKKTGIKVTYDVFDSNDVLFAKLLAGSTGYDLVVPSASFLAKQIKAGIFMKLDKSKLKNYGNLDADIMKLLQNYDPNNDHSLPYLWGTTGIGYNVGKVKEILGDDAPVDSWDLVFNPKYASKLAECGISMLDAADELIPSALKYLGKNPGSFDTKDITKSAYEVLKKARPYVKYFHSSSYISDLANGDICVAIGWSGDIIQAQTRALEAKNGVDIVYYIPKEGAGLWFDMISIPKDAKNVDEAYAMLDYLLEPEVMGAIVNYVAYPSANKAALKFVDKGIKSDPTIYPTDDVKKNLFTFATYPAKVQKILNRTWTKLKTEK